MAQVLKDDIREKILNAALQEFFEKGYKSAAMRNIAEIAKIPTGLIYSYYKNKETLFDEVLRPVNYNWYAVLSAADVNHKNEPKDLSNAERKCLLNLLDHRKEFIIMVDKSQGTKYENQKEEIISITENHLNDHVSVAEYDPILIHIVANNFVEGLLQIMYHYKNKKWAVEMLNKISYMYFRGIGL